jgi:hypothetical protein
MREQLDAILAKWKSLSALPEKTPAEIEAKKKEFNAFTTGKNAYLLNQIAAIPIAQFYIPKTPENAAKIITDDQFRRYWSGSQTPQGQGVAAALGIAHRKRFFHWFLEFPEVMARGGFDCILGNPPYLGSQSLSGTYGYPFCTYVKHQFAPTGLSDLVVYFLRRLFTLLRPGGFTAIITTNSIKDGDNRRDGLEQVLLQGGAINMAVRGIRWPGRANVVVSLLALHKGAWSRPRLLDGQTVNDINAFFEEHAAERPPVVLDANAARVFQGSIFLGDGFLLTHEDAARLRRVDPRNREVLFPVINGREVNNEPDQTPGRSIINFHDWSIDKARTYSEPFAIVEEKVKPFRATQNRQRNRDVWWIYAEHRPGLNRGLAGLPRCFVTARVTKHLNFSAMPTGYVFLNNLYVFTTDRWDLYGVVQSVLHEVWARKHSMSLKQDLQYSPSDCFVTFAFPEGLLDTPLSELAEIAERHYEHRQSLMQSLWLGLTDIYNLFHARDLSAAKVVKVSKKSAAEAERGYQGLLELRRLHVELDQAVLHAYGWDAGGANNGSAGPINLAHDFYEVETLPENDRVRYTISPAARKEVLKRLLALNHERAKAEAAANPTKGKKKRVKDEEDESPPALFGGEEA